MNLKKIAHYAVLIVIDCIFLVPLLYVFYNSLLRIVTCRPRLN